MSDSEDNDVPKMRWNRKRPYTVKRYLEWCYMYFCISVGIQMLEPWERGLFNVTIILLLAMSFYTAYLFLPGHFHAMVVYFVGTNAGES